MKIRTGDKVKVLSGKDRGKEGKVIQVLKNKTNDKYYAVVEGANLLKKHMRPRKQGEKGQIIELPAPLHISKVMLIDPKSGKATRVGYKMEGKEKKRVAKISGEIIS
ncbi:MAG: 50S ribosomal protein L24 [Candidatus Magasanikbacteria bacterium GW2011_GWC2_37_14]|uniref:Large ribosomal subunit protein uL24 n=1 Tax=Candidatus Magasanikbacteria bacterium GW2011_GWC2_37_14 TaxID=1619046 RepID=A0A0G0GLV9_9BACT|nr:MAG: 50S ribosomal protein L24 [Candidatus Magasanikbacteria bacterium GW2011_GWC2_37_14]